MNQVGLPNHPRSQLRHTRISIRFFKFLRGSGTNCGQTQDPRKFEFSKQPESPHKQRLFGTFAFIRYFALGTLPKQARNQLRYIPITDTFYTIISFLSIRFSLTNISFSHKIITAVNRKYIKGKRVWKETDTLAEGSRARCRGRTTVQWIVRATTVSASASRSRLAYRIRKNRPSGSFIRRVTAGG